MLDEEVRLWTLRQYRILDTPPEHRYDELVRVLARVCDVPTALISLVDRDRQWIKAEVGFGQRETPRDVSFCSHAICERDVMVVPNAVDDPRFEHNPLVTGAPGIRFYAGTPLRAFNGLPLGTLCVIDQRPRELDATHRETLLALGHQVEALLEQRRLAAALADAQNRKQTLVRWVLHDVGNALGAMTLNVDELAAKIEECPQIEEIAGDLAAATGNLRQLLGSLREVERAERGELTAKPGPVDLADLLGDVLRRWVPIAASRGVALRVSNAAAVTIEADRTLLGRVLDNLTSNALDFAPHASVVDLAAAGDVGGVELRVDDEGPGVPEHVRGRIFDLYGTADIEPAHARISTGLGLAFCRAAVEAHGGRIWVEPRAPHGSSFRIYLPAIGTSSVSAT
jgi:signal transduction histidine kinase